MNQGERIRELEDTLKTCMDAIQINLQRANYKDEVVLYDAFVKARKVMSKDEVDEE